MFDLKARDIALILDPAGGMLRALTIRDGGRTIRPLHRAPWVGEVLAPDTPVHLAGLEGDFFCAPFARAEGASGMHGWPANGTWVRADGPGLTTVLDHPVQGARLTKVLTVRDGEPFVYQDHVFDGGNGEVSVANHAMVSLPHGGHLRFSPKAFFETSPSPQETDPARGRSALTYPARSPDPRAFPAQGGPVDLTQYPWRPGHEDFAVGVEAPGLALGWTAVTRIGQGDLYLSLRDARALPMTMLWHSDGGRDYAPWSGRNRGCLGVEEGAARHMLGVAATESPDALTQAGQPGGLTLHPGQRTHVRHVIGAIDWPSGEPVASLTAVGDSLTIRGEGGATRTVPWWGAFLQV